MMLNYVCKQEPESTKKGGLNIYWDEYNENIEGVILGGGYKRRFSIKG